jgi:phosphoribosylformylglycinamidine (FGAM) synthase PurS component
MADGKLKRYLVSGDMIVCFNIEVEADSEDEAEEIVSDMSAFDLVADADIEDVNIGYVECLDDDEA